MKKKEEEEESLHLEGSYAGDFLYLAISIFRKRKHSQATFVTHSCWMPDCGFPTLLGKPKLLSRSDFFLASHMSLKHVGGFRAYLFLFDFITQSFGDLETFLSILLAYWYFCVLHSAPLLITIPRFPTFISRQAM